MYNFNGKEMTSMKFEMWSLGHYLMMISPFVIAILLFFLTQGKSDKYKRLVGIILSVICVVLLILRNIEIFSISHKIEPEIIPFQICHFANFVLLFGFLFKNKVWLVIAFCFNLPFAFLSLLFANGLENYSTLYSLRAIAYIWGHILIVAVTLWAFLAGVIESDKKTFKLGMISILLMFVLSVPINNIFMKIMPGFTSNYFYSFKPEKGTPLEIAFNLGENIKFLGMTFNPIYLIITSIFGIALYSLLYKLLQVYNHRVYLTKVV